MSKSHNKRRNTALLYEFLVRHVSNCLIENKKGEAQKALDISKKYFHKGSPLKQELKLFKNITESNLSSKETGARLLKELVDVSSKQNFRDLDVYKSKLIKEINYSFDSKKIYSYRVPNYTVLASAQTLFNESRSRKKTLSPAQRLKLEETIIDFVSIGKNKPQVKEEKLKNTSLISKMVVSRFKQKYQNVLSEGQKSFLFSYALYKADQDKNSFEDAYKNNILSMKKALVEIKDPEISSDSNTLQKLNECRQLLDSPDINKVNENNIVLTLKFMDLVKEIKQGK